ncbi:MAG: hypothetical protein ACLTYN_00040 [Dysosmobacter welbionis]
MMCAMSPDHRLGDLKILLQTVSSVMRREGISSGTSATMEEFKEREMRCGA